MTHFYRFNCKMNPANLPDTISPSAKKHMATGIFATFHNDKIRRFPGVRALIHKAVATLQVVQTASFMVLFKNNEKFNYAEEK